MSGQRLTVPEPKIELYTDGFEAASDLGRTTDGKKLSDLVEKIEEPMVIAVDAPWGAGKSVFLKCWVGAHVRDNGGSANTVYFDAFKEDYLDDPLVSLVRTVSKRIEGLTPDDDNDESEKTRVQKLKESVRKAKVFAPALGRAALRLGVAAGTAGLIRNIDDIAESVLDEAAKQGAKELDNAIGTFWQAEEARADAMEGFRTYLTDLAAEQKLVIVVDELDRCRPDYALNLLEVIKHFFNVPNVHFVLGVNLTELQNSVRARYGAGVNAGLYLQKFVTVTMPLPVRNRDFRWDANADHFINISNELELDSKGYLWKSVEQIIKDCAPRSMTLRSIERLVTLMMLSSSAARGYMRQTNGHDTLRAALLIIKVCNSEKYQNILDGDIEETGFLRCFGLGNAHAAQTSGQDMIAQAASYIFTPFADRNDETTGAPLFQQTFMARRGDEDMEYLTGPQILQKLATEELEAFQLPS